MGFVAAFVVLTGIVASGVTQPAENAVNEYSQSLQGNAGLDALMIGITTTGDVWVLFPFAVILTIIRRTRKAGLIFLIAIVILAIAVAYMKPFFGRVAPPYQFDPAIDLPENFGIEGDSLAPFAAGFSYPSGHASRVTALAIIVGHIVYQKSKPASYAVWAYAILVAVTRVYVQQHFPLDLIGGFLLSMIISTVLVNAMKIWQPFQLSRFKGKEAA